MKGCVFCYCPSTTFRYISLQIDTKFLEPLPGKRKSYWQFTAIDDCTRLRILKIYERNNQKNAMDFVDYVLSRLPFRVQAIQTDNGSEFSAQFHCMCRIWALRTFTSSLALLA